MPPEMIVGENPPEGAILDYYLAGPASGPVTLTISDSAGHVVRELTSTAPPADTIMPNVPEYWLQPPTVLSTASGMHRVNWDLRYPDPPTLNYGYYGTLLDYREYTLNWHATPGHTYRSTIIGMMVLPGTYVAKLTVDGQLHAADHDRPRSARERLVRRACRAVPLAAAHGGGTHGQLRGSQLCPAVACGAHRARRAIHRPVGRSANRGRHAITRFGARIACDDRLWRRAPRPRAPVLGSVYCRCDADAERDRRRGRAVQAARRGDREPAEAGDDEHRRIERTAREAGNPRSRRGRRQRRRQALLDGPRPPASPPPTAAASERVLDCAIGVDRGMVSLG